MARSLEVATAITILIGALGLRYTVVVAGQITGPVGL
jgi:formate-dependent nitrite reductase membrane component NrfD